MKINDDDHNQFSNWIDTSSMNNGAFMTSMSADLFSAPRSRITISAFAAVLGHMNPVPDILFPRRLKNDWWLPRAFHPLPLPRSVAVVFITKQGYRKRDSGRRDTASAASPHGKYRWDLFSRISFLRDKRGFFGERRNGRDYRRRHRVSSQSVESGSIFAPSRSRWSDKTRAIPKLHSLDWYLELLGCPCKVAALNVIPSLFF